MTRAMLLCAGLGTRLGPLSDVRPKPMLPVCDIPILHYGIAMLVGQGICDIVINLHHQADLIEREIGDGSRFGARIRYTREAEILGTGGGLKNALHLLDPEQRDEPFLSINGKLIFDLDVAALLRAFESDSDVLGMMVVRHVPDALEWGALDVQPTGEGRLRVRNILGEGEYMFCGVHVTRPSTVARLPAGDACMIRQGYLPWLRGGEQVAAHAITDGYFAEHSTPERYLQSSIDLLAGQTLRFPPGPLRGVDETARVAASAVIEAPVRIGASAQIGEGARIGPHVVIGAGAVVEPGAQLENSVVWAGATASGKLARAIVAPNGVVQTD